MCVYLSQLTLATVKFSACHPVYQAAATISTVELSGVVGASSRTVYAAKAAEAKMNGIEKRESILPTRRERMDEDGRR